MVVRWSVRRLAALKMTHLLRCLILILCILFIHVYCLLGYGGVIRRPLQ